MSEYTVWIEAEQWDADEWNPKDCNSDVMVTFEGKGRWVATFFTYENISTLAAENSESGECMNGSYCWATDMILIDEFTRTRVEEVVAHMIAEGEFETAFTFIAESTE